MKVKFLSGGKRVKLLEELVVQTSAGETIVPRGFITDFASIPQLFRSLIPQLGKHNRAAIVHDYFYRTPLSRTVIRREADNIFLDLMKQDGVAFWRRYAMYWAVRLSGSCFWRE